MLTNLENVDTTEGLRESLGISKPSEKLSNVLSKAIRQVVADADSLLKRSDIAFNGAVWLSYEYKTDKPCQVCLFGLALLSGRCELGLINYDSRVTEDWFSNVDYNRWLNNVQSDAINAVRQGEPKRAFNQWYRSALPAETPLLRDCGSLLAENALFETHRPHNDQVVDLKYYIQEFDDTARTILLSVADGIEQAEALLAQGLCVGDFEKYMDLQVAEYNND